MSLVDLKLTKKEMNEEAQSSDMPSYPYGAQINLDTDELEKLGIGSDNLPAVGAEYHIRAVGKVTRISENETEGSDYSCGLCIQITAIELTPEINEDFASEESEDAERSEFGPKTMVHSTYRR